MFVGEQATTWAAVSGSSNEPGRRGSTTGPTMASTLSCLMSRSKATAAVAGSPVSSSSAASTTCLPLHPAGVVDLLHGELGRRRAAGAEGGARAGGRAAASRCAARRRRCCAAAPSWSTPAASVRVVDAGASPLVAGGDGDAEQRRQSAQTSDEAARRRAYASSRLMLAARPGRLRPPGVGQNRVDGHRPAVPARRLPAGVRRRGRRRGATAPGRARPHGLLPDRWRPAARHRACSPALRGRRRRARTATSCGTPSTARALPRGRAPPSTARSTGIAATRSCAPTPRCTCCAA